MLTKPCKRMSVKAEKSPLIEHWEVSSEKYLGLPALMSRFKKNPFVYRGG